MSPRIILAHDFITDRECDLLIGVGSEAGFARCKVGVGVDARVSTIRTSEGVFLKGPFAQYDIVKAVERRIYQFSGLHCDGEPMQVVRYRVGQDFQHHFDNSKNDISREVTCIIYLNDVEEGGCTAIPDASPVSKTIESDMEKKSKFFGMPSESGKLGLAIKPRKVSPQIMLPIALTANAS